MPTYDFRNKETQELFKKFMSISECEIFLKDNENIEQVIENPPYFLGRDVSPSVPKDFLKQPHEVKVQYRKENPHKFKIVDHVQGKM